MEQTWLSPGEAPLEGAEPEPRIVQVSPSVHSELLAAWCLLGWEGRRAPGKTPLPRLGPHQGPRLKPHSAWSGAWGWGSGGLHIFLQAQGGAGSRGVTLTLWKHWGE